jgi:hypothetical protein
MPFKPYTRPLSLTLPAQVPAIRVTKDAGIQTNTALEKILGLKKGDRYDVWVDEEALLFGIHFHSDGLYLIAGSRDIRLRALKQALGDYGIAVPKGTHPLLRRKDQNPEWVLDIGKVLEQAEAEAKKAENTPARTLPLSGKKKPVDPERAPPPPPVHHPMPAAAEPAPALNGGVKPWASRMTPHEVWAIMQAKADGMTNAQAAKECDCPVTDVAAVMANGGWAAKVERAARMPAVQREAFLREVLEHFRKRQALAETAS